MSWYVMHPCHVGSRRGTGASWHAVPSRPRAVTEKSPDHHAKKVQALEMVPQSEDLQRICQSYLLYWMRWHLGLAELIMSALTRGAAAATSAVARALDGFFHGVTHV